MQRFLKFADKKARGLRSQADSTLSENSRSKWGYYSQNYYICYFIWIPDIAFWPVSWNLQSNVSGVDFLRLSRHSLHSTTFSLGKASRDISKLCLAITKPATINQAYAYHHRPWYKTDLFIKYKRWKITSILIFSRMDRSLSTDKEMKNQSNKRKKLLAILTLKKN